MERVHKEDKKHYKDSKVELPPFYGNNFFEGYLY